MFCLRAFNFVQNNCVLQTSYIGGSGLTPMLQVIEELLESPDDETELSLLFCNQVLLRCQRMLSCNRMLRLDGVCRLLETMVIEARSLLASPNMPCGSMVNCVLCLCLLIPQCPEDIFLSDRIDALVI